MKLSISNLGWREQDNQMVYDLMEKYGFTGLEIAPTKILPQNPYDNLSEIKTWKENLQARYNFEIPSMQAVLYKRPEQLFKNKEERDFLLYVNAKTGKVENPYRYLGLRKE